MAVRTLNMQTSSDDFDPPYVSRSPQARLWEAVIHRALWDYKHFWESGASSLSKLLEARRAQIWAFSTHATVDDVGSLLWCCSECFPDFADNAVNKIRRELAAPLPSSYVLKQWNLLRTP